jgi:hypothetical protein
MVEKIGAKQEKWAQWWNKNLYLKMFTKPKGYKITL